ncbi:MAG: hypothetical protein ACI9JK_001728 [Phycisphaerales bacterium]|jgi:hypothetical protein
MYLQKMKITKGVVHVLKVPAESAPKWLAGLV